MKYVVDNGVVRIGNEEVEFPWVPVQIEQFGESLLIRFSQEVTALNICKVSITGKIEWRVSSSDPSDLPYFTGMKLWKSTISAQDSTRRFYCIDPQSGIADQICNCHNSKARLKVIQGITNLDS